MITVILMLLGCSFNKSFSQAKEQTVKFFEKNQNDFETAKDTILTAKSADDVSIKNISYISFDTVETSDMITFDYDAQGMLGGQYWGIVFSSDDIPGIDNSIPTLTESETKGIYYWEESDGNNIFAMERITENWFFYYFDYDGHLNISDFRTK